jgi:hypothetical protein
MKQSGDGAGISLRLSGTLRRHTPRVRRTGGSSTQVQRKTAGQPSASSPPHPQTAQPPILSTLLGVLGLDTAARATESAYLSASATRLGTAVTS